MNTVIAIALSLASLAVAAPAVLILSAVMLNRLRPWPEDYSEPPAAMSRPPAERCLGSDLNC